MDRANESTERTEVISVADFDRLLRRAVERASGRAWVEGEVASLRTAGSGHVYFVLKDEREEAILDCVMYRTSALRARRHLFEGARAQVLGKATVWAPRGRLQFVADAVRPAGRGALLAALEQLKEVLRAEGLFDPARKRRLPEDPRVVGIVTSLHGAALHDIVTVGFRRGAVRFVVSPAQVQGEGAALSLRRALDRLERYPGLDVVIIGRGGGSGEDLMAFNEEAVVRRVAAARVPVVSAVGHEVDTTLTDLVADVRAATPSQAAEIVVLDQEARCERLLRCRTALARAMAARVLEDQSTLDRLRGKLTDPRFVIAEKQQYLDDLFYRLERVVRRRVGRRRAEYESIYPRLATQHPRAVLARARGRLSPLGARLESAMNAHLAAAAGDLTAKVTALDSLSPLSVLSRGYAIVTRTDGRAVRGSSELSPGDIVSVRVHQGRFEATVERTAASPDADGGDAADGLGRAAERGAGRGRS